MNRNYNQLKDQESNYKPEGNTPMNTESTQLPAQDKATTEAMEDARKLKECRDAFLADPLLTIMLDVAEAAGKGVPVDLVKNIAKSAYEQGANDSLVVLRDRLLD